MKRNQRLLGFFTLALILVSFVLLMRKAPQLETVPELLPASHYSSDLLPLTPFYEAKDEGSTQRNGAGQCRRFSDQPSVRIDVFFGYKDARPSRFVGDRLESLVLLSALRRECKNSKRLACGYRQNVNDPFELLKEQDGHTWRIKIHRSSLSLDDQFNREQAEQSRLSAKVTQAFQESLENSDVVFYNGHSRDGGGPDFEPPRLDSSGHVLYSYYRNQQPGLKLIESVRPLKDTQLLGLFSCASTGHFLARMKSQHKQRDFITSSALLYYADASQNLYESIEMLMRGGCANSWAKALRTADRPVASTLTTNKKKEL